MESKTANRGALRKKAHQGLLIARLDYSITDDSRHDQGRGDWMPVNMLDEHFRGHKEGYANLSDWDFQTSSGGAWRRDDGDIVFVVHSNCAYTLRIVDKPVKPRIRRYADVVPA